ncbi:cysteine desulfurase family protein [Pseudoroseicyclus tamaricis]|uniref:Cysteine desulfurase n=1 Tax=Pseudoroseicyclus tamaricis TaxID=2705421 RepID=A0A6B2JQM9_9RHOB|nr:aminotransferase class V-fold PLP-dependent enzyme [Pseudoroseicyclus tamaricis]NDV00987.1 aminotransferase class V-fold PLP-dependent enzyme [Pseudoroseicyclus tamaricis]
MPVRHYLDHAATTPLRPEAREAMAAAMDIAGNPSSVHAEGRAAKGVVERARAQVAEAIGAEADDIIFTSGATEALALGLAGRGLACAPVEHEAALAWCEPSLEVSRDGRVTVPDPARATLQLANSETGILQELPEGLALSDITQAFGKLPFAFGWSGISMAVISAHKFGGPKGVGALVLKPGTEVAARTLGGGQEMSRRAGTENMIGIAGMGAAAAAAQADLANGVWEEVAARRNLLESALEDEAPGLHIVGRTAPRLPNVTSVISPGWKGETQVMVMDLAGFATSAGSACSSGKVRRSRVLEAMGYGDDAGCSLRISLGPDTTDDTVLAFARTFGEKRRRALGPARQTRMDA